jgi:hypothetical protein
MKFYSYVTQTPEAPGMEDEPIGSDGRSIDRDLKTVRGVVSRLKRAWPGKSFKVFTFTNIYDPKSFRLVHTEIC